jgi:hypothetical protein
MRDDLSPIRGEIREPGFRRLSHGLYQPLCPDLTARQELMRDLQAWLLVLPADAAYTHITGAWLNDWWLPVLPKFVPVFAASSVETNRPRRAGLVCSRLKRDSRPVRLHGLPVDRPEEVLLRSARDLAQLDLIAMVVSALRSGVVGRAELERVCATRRPGVRPLRHALRLANARNESPGEVLLTIFHESVDIPVEPQVELYEDGRFLGRADLLIKGTNHVQEYDGPAHRSGRQHMADLRRDRGLASTAYIRRGYTADDLLNHPLAVLQEIDRAIGRRHRPERVERWRTWVSRSTYSEAGRARLMNRWLRVSGVTDWS